MQAGEASKDKITSLTLSLAFLPLDRPISDAKVLTGRQRPMTEIASCSSRSAPSTDIKVSATATPSAPAAWSVRPRQGDRRRGDRRGPQRHPADLDETDLGGCIGRPGGLATQAIAAIDIALWDLKAKRAGLPLAKLLGAYRDSVACYNTSGGFLSSSIEEIIENARTPQLSEGIGGSRSRSDSPTRESI